MSFSQAFIKELQYEAGSTKKMLGRVPFEHLGWKPHEKSMHLGRLAVHVAEIPSWAKRILGNDELNMADFKYNPPVVNNNEELVALHENMVNEAISSLEKTSDEDIMKPWTLKRGEQVLMTMPKAAAFRNLVMNHMVHHRGQLSTYLRAHDVPVPGMYGPSADER